MDPATLYILGISTATLLAQLWSAEKARGANKDAMRKIEAIWDKIVPPSFGVGIGESPDSIFDKLQTPEYEQFAGSGEAYKVVEKYVPQLMPHINERAPKIAERTAVGKQGMQAQRDALEEYQRISSAETDPLLAQRMMESQRRAGTDARSKQSALLEQFARRGQLGSGMSLAAQQQAGADEMDRLSMDTQRAAAEQYQNRLRAMGAGADLGGQMSRDDLADQERKASSLNDFNQRATDNFRRTATMNRELQNDAQQKNIATAQDIANKEADRTRSDRMARNVYNDKKYDRALANKKAVLEIEQQKFNNEMDMANARGGLITRSGEHEAGKYGAYGQAGQATGEGAMKAYIFSKMAPTPQAPKPYPKEEDDEFYYPERASGNRQGAY